MIKQNNKTPDEDDMVPRTAPKPNHFEAQGTAKPDVPDLTFIQSLSLPASSCNTLPSLTSNDRKYCKNTPPLHVHKNLWPKKDCSDDDGNVLMPQKQESNFVKINDVSIPQTIVYKQNKSKSDNNCPLFDTISLNLPTKVELCDFLNNFIEGKIKSQIKQVQDQLTEQVQKIYEQNKQKQQPQQQQNQQQNILPQQQEQQQEQQPQQQQNHQQQQQQESHQIKETEQTIKNEQIYEFISKIDMRMDNFERKLQNHIEVLENCLKVENNDKIDKSIQCDIGNQNPNTEHYIIDFAEDDDSFDIKQIANSSSEVNNLTQDEIERNALMENLRRKYLTLKPEYPFSFVGKDSNKSRKQKKGSKEKK